MTTKAWHVLLQSAPGIPGFEQAGRLPVTSETPVAVKWVLKCCFAACAVVIPDKLGLEQKGFFYLNYCNGVQQG